MNDWIALLQAIRLAILSRLMRHLRRRGWANSLPDLQAFPGLLVYRTRTLSPARPAIPAKLPMPIPRSAHFYRPSEPALP